MSNVQLNTYKAEIAAAIREANAALEEALRCIRNQEDGPLTMRAILLDISARIADVETEVMCMSESYQNVSIMFARVSEQRDEAIRQRNAAVREMLAMQQAEREKDDNGYYYP